MAMHTSVYLVYGFKLEHDYQNELEEALQDSEVHVFSFGDCYTGDLKKYLVSKVIQLHDGYVGREFVLNVSKMKNEHVLISKLKKVCDDHNIEMKNPDWIIGSLFG